MFTRFKEHECCRVIFIASAIFYFTALLGGVADSEIQELAMAHFSNLPGFATLLLSRNEGRFFEMEVALCIQYNGILRNHMPLQDILGFDLELNFDHGGVGYVEDENFVPIRTTELDVVTSDFVIECKCSANFRSMAQFIKEKNVLMWARWVWHEVQRGKMKIKHQFVKKNESKSMFILKKTFKKTKSKQIVSCSWINSHDSGECIDLFKDMILMLSKKELLVFFKNSTDDEDFLSALLTNKINFLENVQFLK
jgi:hypothetical protein